MNRTYDAAMYVWFADDGLPVCKTQMYVSVRSPK